MEDEMKVRVENNGNVAKIKFSHGKENLDIAFSLESMKTMRFLESALRADKVKDDGRKAKAYIEVMGKAIGMIGENAFEDLEDFYDNADEELTVAEFIGAIMSAFNTQEELPKE